MRFLKPIGILLIVMGCFQSGLAIFQYFAQENLGLTLLGERGLDTRIVSLDSCRWIFDTPGATYKSLYRGMGTFCHPNILGGFLTLALLFNGYLFWKTRNKWLLIAYPFQLFALLITYSRAALFAWIISSIFWLIWMRWRQKQWLIPLACLMFLSLSLNLSLIYRQISDRGGIVNYNQEVKDSDGERMFYHYSALRIISDNPLKGVGFEQFKLVSPCCPHTQMLRPGAGTANVHNIFLLIAAEMGLPALLLFLVWLFLLAWRILLSTSAEMGLLAAAFGALLFISLCDHYPISLQPGRLLFFGVAGLLASFSNLEKRSQSFAIAP